MASKNYKRSKSVSLEEETIQKLQVRANRHAGNGHGIWSKYVRFALEQLVKDDPPVGSGTYVPEPPKEEPHAFVDNGPLYPGSLDRGCGACGYGGLVTTLHPDFELPG